MYAVGRDLKQLFDLADAVKYDDGITRLDTLIRVLLRLDAKTIMNFAVRYVKNYIPAFMQLCPSAIWPMDRLNKLEKLMASESPDDELPDMDIGRVDMLPATFLNAFIYLRAMVASTDNVQAVAKYAAETINWIFATQLYAFQREISPELAQIDDNREEIDREERRQLRAKIEYQVLNRSEIKELRRKLWRQLVNDLEILLEVSG